MKNLSFIMIILCCLLLLSSCVFSRQTPFEEGKLKDTFYSEELLTEYGLSDMPIPKLENSYLDGATLYCNLSTAEYTEYVKSIAEYLRTKDGIYHAGYKYGTHVEGLLVLIWHVDDYAPLLDDYAVDTESNRFIYSSSPYVEYSGEYTELSDRFFISIEWEPTSYNSSKNTYTTVIKLESSGNYSYYSCYHEHDYLSEVYPVAGSDKQITISICSRCHDRVHSEYLGSYDTNIYPINIVKGKGYVINCPEKTFSNVLVELKTKALGEGDLRVVVNGTEIPKTYNGVDCWEYAFIMPCGSVEIEIELIETQTELSSNVEK